MAAPKDIPPSLAAGCTNTLSTFGRDSIFDALGQFSPTPPARHTLCTSYSLVYFVTRVVNISSNNFHL